MDLIQSDFSKLKSITVVNDLSGMWLIFLEAGVALGLLLFIVWWTWPSGPKEPKDKEAPRND